MGQLLCTNHKPDVLFIDVQTYHYSAFYDDDNTIVVVVDGGGGSAATARVVVLFYGSRKANVCNRRTGV